MPEIHRQSRKSTIEVQNMKFLLVAINAKYIHSNPGVYSLKMYAEKQGGLKQDAGLPCPRVDIRMTGEPAGRGITSGCLCPRVDIQIAEYTINHQMDQILEDIYRRKPDVVGFSCYIWNIRYVREIIHDLHKVLPGTDIWLGGPEVSFDALQLLAQEPQVLGIMKGEGEETFARLVTCYESLGTSAAQASEEQKQCPGQMSPGTSGHEAWAPADAPGPVAQADVPRPKVQESAIDVFWHNLAGLGSITFRDPTGQIRDLPMGPLLDLDQIPFPYADLDDFAHRIVYYESSRGCPFSCSYCLSSVDKTVRFRSLGLVEAELQFFLDRQVPQVKFVDRTFNCRKSHAMGVWRYILEHDNGITNFHFEIAADLLDEEEQKLLARMRPGLIQLEIGVQSTHPQTIREIRRKMDVSQVESVVARIRAGRNIHQHLDLIAGLPYEDYDRFHVSFNQVYAMRPEQLQLGFLKVLKGSYMEEMAPSYGLVFREQPPYEVISTRWLSFGEVLRLKGVEDMVEVYYNSCQFATVLNLLEPEFPDAFIMFEKMADYYRRNGLWGRSHSRLARFELLHRFIREHLERRENGQKRADGQKREDGQERADGQKCEDGPGREDPQGSRKLACFEDALMRDLYLRENAKSRPDFAPDQAPYKERIRGLAPGLRTLGAQVHVEVFQSGEVWLFDYRSRDPLTQNARMTRLG